MDQRFGQVDKRFDQAKVDVDKRFDEAKTDMNRRFDDVKADMDKRFEQVISSIDRLGDKLDYRDEKQRGFTLRMFTIAIGISILGAVGAFLKTMGITIAFPIISPMAALCPRPRAALNSGRCGGLAYTLARTMGLRFSPGAFLCD